MVERHRLQVLPFIIHGSENYRKYSNVDISEDNCGRIANKWYHCCSCLQYLGLLEERAFLFQNALKTRLIDFIFTPNKW